MDEKIEADIPVIEPIPLAPVKLKSDGRGMANGTRNSWFVKGDPRQAPWTKERGETARRVTRTISKELEKVVTINGIHKKKRQVLAALLSDALLKGRVDFIDGRSINLNAKTWSDLMIRTVEHLDGKVDPKIEVNTNIMASPLVVTTSDLDALTRIYAKNITPVIEEDESE